MARCNGIVIDAPSPAKAVPPLRCSMMLPPQQYGRAITERTTSTSKSESHYLTRLSDMPN
jgi:hypothetical protein